MKRGFQLGAAQSKSVLAAILHHLWRNRIWLHLWKYREEQLNIVPRQGVHLSVVFTWHVDYTKAKAMMSCVKGDTMQDVS